MGKMAQLFRIFRKSSSTEKPIDMIGCDGQPIFDKKYKVVVKRLYTPGFLDMIEWVNLNSNGLVEVKFNNGYGSEAIYIGFVDSDDALFFKIKYSA